MMRSAEASKTASRGERFSVTHDPNTSSASVSLLQVKRRWAETFHVSKSHKQQKNDWPNISDMMFFFCAIRQKKETHKEKKQTK